MLIHYKKSFATYLFFASSLVGLCPELEGIRAFGTDGEKPLIDAFAHEFRYSQHLTCFIHAKRNIKDKLQSCSIPTEASKTIIGDIFGHTQGDVYVEGLVDSFSIDDFQAKIDSLFMKWRNFEISSSAELEKFIEYFNVNKVNVNTNFDIVRTR